MPKRIFYGEDARARVLAGAKALFEAVKETYGPKAGNVVIDRAYGSPVVTHDGVTVAESIELPKTDDASLGQETGARLIKEAAAKLNKIAGDGTTTVTVLTYEILQRATKMIAAGHNSQDIRHGLEQASLEAVAIVKDLSEDVSDDIDRIAEVASISAGDKEIGAIIADVVKEIGKDGVITAEPSQGLTVEAEIVKGYTFDRGWVSPYFINDADEQQTILDNPVFIITSKQMHIAADIFPLIERLVKSGRKEIVIIADDIQGEALNVLIVNKLKQAVNVVAVKPPSFGDRRITMLEDIAALVGCEVIPATADIEDIDSEYVGGAAKIVVNKESTTIFSGIGDITDRVEGIHKQLELEEDDYNKLKLTRRAAALEGKVAIMHVGGATETEIDERKYRVDDAVAATRAALDEGIVAGGGVTLMDVANRLEPKTEGHMILIDALRQPFVHIMKNANLKAEYLSEKIKELDKPGYGINVMDPAAGIVSMKDSGVIDPARVTKEAILSAVSIAATAATMSALVVEIPEKVDPTAADALGY